MPNKVAQAGNSTVIAANGSSNNLMFYVQPIGRCELGRTAGGRAG